MTSPDFRAGWDAATLALRTLSPDDYDQDTLWWAEHLAKLLSSRAPEVAGQAETQSIYDSILNNRFMSDGRRVADVQSVERDVILRRASIEKLLEEHGMNAANRALVVPMLVGATPPDPETAAREKARDVCLLSECGEALGSAMQGEGLLRQLLQHPSPLVREGAVYGLAEQRDCKPDETIRQLAGSDPSPGVRLAIAAAFNIDAAESAERGKGE